MQDHLILPLCALAGLAPAQSAPVVVEMKVLPGLQYSVPRFAAKPGQAVEIRFHNNDEMAHNLLVVKPGRRLLIVTAALALGANGPAKSYVPDSPDVLWSLPILNPGVKRTLRFVAPKKKGVYPYVCTYPGHGVIMFGAMYVGRKMPAIGKDKHVSPIASGLATPSAHQHHSLHAWKPDRRPIMYRIFMPNASPAAIAVGLDSELSYCFDAGTCRLRYAWRGGFVDPMPVWKENGNGLAKLQGKTFYTEKGFPFRLGNGEQPKPEFLGYRLIDRLPEFRYRLGDLEVRELIRVQNGNLVRRFRFSGASRSIRFHPEWDGKVVVTTAPHAWRKGGINIDTGNELTVRISMRENGR